MDFVETYQTLIAGLAALGGGFLAYKGAVAQSKMLLQSQKTEALERRQALLCLIYVDVTQFVTLSSDIAQEIQEVRENLASVGGDVFNIIHDVDVPDVHAYLYEDWKFHIGLPDQVVALVWGFRAATLRLESELDRVKRSLPNRHRPQPLFEAAGLRSVGSHSSVDDYLGGLQVNFEEVTEKGVDLLALLENNMETEMLRPIKLRDGHAIEKRIRQRRATR